MTREQKLERWAEREITRNINHIILENDDGSILAFGRYDIQPHDQGVTVRIDQQLAQFHDRRTALSWCVAQHKRLLHFGIHIQAIDQRYRTQRSDLECLQQQIRNCRNVERRNILRAKLQNRQWHVQTLRNELEKCAVKAKYLQLRGFEK
jgi:hypothetical protein